MSLESISEIWNTPQKSKNISVCKIPALGSRDIHGSIGLRRPPPNASQPLHVKLSGPEFGQILTAMAILPPYRAMSAMTLPVLP